MVLLFTSQPFTNEAFRLNLHWRSGVLSLFDVIHEPQQERVCRIDALPKFCGITPLSCGLMFRFTDVRCRLE